MKDRIQRIIARENLTASKFADIIGVQRSSISHILSGRNNPGLDFLNKILVHFPHISGDWLITGQGSMVKSSVNGPKMPTLFDKKPIEQDMAAPLEERNKEPLTAKQTLPTFNDAIDKGMEGESQVKSTMATPLASSSIELPLGSPKESAIERIMIFYADKTFDAYSPR